MSEITPIRPVSVKQRFESRFPGLKLVSYNHHERARFVTISISGSGRDLVAHGFIVPKMLELLPKCGIRCYSGRAMDVHDLPFCAEVARVAAGYRVGRYFSRDETIWMIRRVLGLAPESITAAPPARPKGQQPYLRLVVDNEAAAVQS